MAGTEVNSYALIMMMLQVDESEALCADPLTVIYYE